MEVHVVTMDGHLNAIVLWALPACGVKLKVRPLSIQIELMLSIFLRSDGATFILSLIPILNYDWHFDACDYLHNCFSIFNV